LEWEPRLVSSTIYENDDSLSRDFLPDSSAKLPIVIVARTFMSAASRIVSMLFPRSIINFSESSHGSKQALSRISMRQAEDGAEKTL
jgi:hypothetical protein